MRSPTAALLGAAFIWSGAAQAGEALVLSNPRAMAPVIIQVRSAIAPELRGQSDGKPPIVTFSGEFRPCDSEAKEDVAWAHGRSVDEEGFARFSVFKGGSARGCLDASGDALGVFPSGVSFYELGGGYFLFVRAGEYDIRWTVYISAEERTRLVVEQRVQIEPPSTADLDFLGRVGSRGFYESVMHSSGKFVENMPASPESAADLDRYAAPIGITLLSYAAKTIDYVAMPSDRERRFVEGLLKIAEELPDSAYSPYVMYMAGSFAIREVEKAMGEPQWPDPYPAIRKHQLYKQGKNYLLFADEHGDPYLKPRAQVRLALLDTMGGLFDEAKRRLDAVETTIGGRVITTAINKMREDVLSAEAQYKEFKRKHDEKSE